MRHRLGITVLFLISTAYPAFAQFTVALPEPRSAEEIRREDYNRLFVSALSKETRSQLASDNQASSSFDSERDSFCATLLREEKDRAECRAAVTEKSVRSYVVGSTPHITRVLLKPRLPLTHSRSELARYLRGAGASEGFSVFSRFAANVSDDEAYVVTNVVRGLTGLTIFAVDYAAVVTKAESGSEAERKEIENDKANLLRMINNGGTLVGKFQAPIHAISGGTFSNASAVSVGAGLLGSVSDQDKRQAAGSVVGEFMSAIAIRNLDGGAERVADLLFGVRGGYARSDRRLVADETDKDIAFGQVAIGLRRNGDLSLSVLITHVARQFRGTVPTLVVNFSAVR